MPFPFGGPATSPFPPWSVGTGRCVRGYLMPHWGGLVSFRGNSSGWESWFYRHVYPITVIRIYRDIHAYRVICTDSMSSLCGHIVTDTCKFFTFVRSSSNRDAMLAYKIILRCYRQYWERLFAPIPTRQEFLPDNGKPSQISLASTFYDIRFVIRTFTIVWMCIVPRS